MNGFDPAAEFLLTLHWPNLFEEQGSRNPDAGAITLYRCKGCDARLVAFEREKHYDRHRRALARQEARRRAEAAKQAGRRLQHARALRRAVKP